MFDLKFTKFINAGALNTITSYIIYAGLTFIIDYQIAYTIAFIFGIFFSYLLNSQYVFKVAILKSKLLLFIFVYLIQYSIGIFLLKILIEYININKILAPIITIIFLIPLTYILTRKVLTN